MEYDQEYLIHNFKLKRCAEFNENVLAKGIAIYEVIKIKQGIPLFLEEHLNRLYTSADISNLSINESYCDIETLIGELIKKNNTKEGKINLIIRFEKENGSSEKDLLIYFTPHYFPSVEEYQNGVIIGSCYATRGNPNAKILNSETRIKANNIIIEEKLFEVLLINDEGFITEGSRSNVFFIMDNKVVTPPVKGVLNGITRMNIIKLCKQNNIEIIEEKIHYSQIKDIDTLFLTGTSIHALAVKKFEDLEFNTNNEILNRIMKLFNELTENYISSKTNPTN